MERDMQGSQQWQWDYKIHLMKSFASRPEPEAAGYFQDLPSDSPALQALFGAFWPDECGFRPRTVVLHGDSGTGRWALARRLLLGWVQGEALQGLFSYVFLLPARDLRGLSESSFLELVSRVWPSAPAAAQDLAAQPHQLLLVLDGFDDLGWTPEDETGPLCDDDWMARQPVTVLVHSLLRKVLLPEASLLITVSDEALGLLRALLVAPRYLWLGSLSVEQRLNLLLKHSCSENERAQALQWAANCQPLLELCRVPALNYLLQAALQVGPAAFRSTVTGLFATWVSQQLMQQQQPPQQQQQQQPPSPPQQPQQPQQQQEEEEVEEVEEEEEVEEVEEEEEEVEEEVEEEEKEEEMEEEKEEEMEEEMEELEQQEEEEGEGSPGMLSPEMRAMVRSLCGLALEGVRRGKTTFSGEDLYDHELRVPQLPALARTHFLIPHQYWANHYTFLHPSLQDFFAALSYALPERVAQPTFPELGSLLPGMPGGLHLLHLDRFLCGLLSREVAGTLRNLLGCTVPPETRQALLRRLSWLGRVAAHQDLLHTFYCLFETQDVAVVGEACAGLRDVSLFLGRHMDLVVSAFCLPACGQLRSLRLQIQGLFLQNPCPEAQPAVPPRLRCQSLLKESWQQLCSVLSAHASLQRLDLAGIVLSEWALKRLCEELQKPTCSIRQLIFTEVHLGPSLTHLWRVLITSPRLRLLGLDSLALQPEDVTIACAVLQHPSCKLSSIRLDSCGLTDFEFFTISRVLTSANYLQSLSLSRNRVSGTAIEALCDGLLAPSCVLQRLILRNCNLEPVACQYLALVLTSTRSLTHLDLSHNCLGVRGMRLLYHALNPVAPASGLRRLLLNWCDLDETACGFLTCVLRSCSSLTHLSLSANPLGDGSAHLLCQALENPTCRLQELELVQCQLTAACCRNLSSVIGSSSCLSSLDLSHNTLGDEGLAVLCEGLQQSTTSLTRLRLEVCGLTGVSAHALSTALPDNRSLLSLNLTGNSFDFPATMLLCGAIANPHCALRSLWMGLGQLPPSVQQLLAELQQLKPSVSVDSGWEEEFEEDRLWWQH